MPIFYKGAAPGTHWHINDARLTGFTPRASTALPNPDRLMQHIARGNADTPYISLTRSFGVAFDYAAEGATPTNPGFVYEVEINDPLPPGMVLFDPVKVVAEAVPSPLAAVPYQHDGRQDFLLSVVLPGTPAKPYISLQGGATPRQPNLSIEVESLVRALRDAEILVNIVPRMCVVNRIDVK